MSTYTVLGAGNGGQTLAAMLQHIGHDVCLWNRNSDIIDSINSRGKITVEGVLNFEAQLSVVSDNLGLVVQWAEIIFIVLPANAHGEIARCIAPFIRPDQMVILNPGRTAGVLEFLMSLKENGCVNLPLVVETQSFLYTCRAKEPGHVELAFIKRDNTTACHKEYRPRLEAAITKLNQIYGNIKIAPSPLQTGLENIGAILHPAPVLLNAGWIESRDVFFPHYYYGISKSIADFLEKVDMERLEVARQYGVRVRSVKEWHEDNYGTKGANLFETLQRNSAYASIDAPRTLNHRYLTEDIPTGLVPISELGRAAGVLTPYIDMIIELGNAMLNIDFRKTGRNLKRLGLEGKTIEEIKRVFE